VIRIGQIGLAVSGKKEGRISFKSDKAGRQQKNYQAESGI
jgi:hypothetical protein